MEEIIPLYRWLRNNSNASNKYVGVIPAPSPQNALKLLSCQDKKAPLEICTQATGWIDQLLQTSQFLQNEFWKNLSSKGEARRGRR